jgi:SpoVK/Ycf46/Vps4 family AAA+-type ATPase
MKGGEQNIDAQARMIFKILTNVRGATIFFDELDDLLRRRRLSEEPTFIKLVPPAMLNRLQDLRDACPAQQICFIIGTNFIDKLDSALIRPGRIDIALDVPYPDHYSKYVIAENLDVPASLIDAIARKTPLWPWAAFRSLCDKLRDDTPSLAELDDVLAQFEAEAERAEFYYHDVARWREPNDRFLAEFVDSLSLEDDDKLKAQLRRLIDTLEKSDPKPDLRELERKLDEAVKRARRMTP